VVVFFFFADVYCIFGDWAFVGLFIFIFGVLVNNKNNDKNKRNKGGEGGMRGRRN
jgi:hypothetical protein